MFPWLTAKEDASAYVFVPERSPECYVKVDKGLEVLESVKMLVEKEEKESVREREGE